MNNKHIHEGWTVQHFIDDLTPMFNLIMSGQSHISKFTRDEPSRLKEWCKDNQPYYKKHIPGVYNHFLNLTGL